VDLPSRAKKIFKVARRFNPLKPKLPSANVGSRKHKQVSAALKKLKLKYYSPHKTWQLDKRFKNVGANQSKPSLTTTKKIIRQARRGTGWGDGITVSRTDGPSQYSPPGSPTPIFGFPRMTGEASISRGPLAKREDKIIRNANRRSIAIHEIGHSDDDFIGKRFRSQELLNKSGLGRRKWDGKKVKRLVGASRSTSRTLKSEQSANRKAIKKMIAAGASADEISGYKRFASRAYNTYRKEAIANLTGSKKALTRESLRKLLNEFPELKTTAFSARVSQ